MAITKRPKRQPPKRQLMKEKIVDAHKHIIANFYFDLAKPKPTMIDIANINKLLASMPDGLKLHFKIDLMLIVHRGLSFKEAYRDADQRVFQELEDNLLRLRALND
jgi:hypothetical protein